MYNNPVLFSMKSLPDTKLYLVQSVTCACNLALPTIQEPLEKLNSLLRALRGVFNKENSGDRSWITV